MIDTKWYLPAFAGLLLAASAFGADLFDRLMSDVRSTEKWKGAKTVSEKMWAIRSIAGSYKVVSKPVSDRYLIKRYAHAQVVMGLDGSETAVGRRKRSEWFTAVPLFLIPLLEPGLLESIPDARAGLKKAGLEVYDIDGKPIGIRRVHQDAHD